MIQGKCKRVWFWVLGMGISAVCMGRVVRFRPLDVRNPTQLHVDHDRLYLVDFPHVAVYSRETGAWICTLGREGEGPGEFRQYIGLVRTFQNHQILVNSLGKLSWFDGSGKWMRELRTPANIWNVLPAGSGFIGHTLSGTSLEGFKALNLYDHRMVWRKELFRKVFLFDESARKRELFTANYRYWVHGGVIWVRAQSDFVIQRFNEAGKPLPSIVDQAYARVACREEHKEQVLDYFRKNPRIRPLFQQFKSRLVFPEYFPAIRTLSFDDDGLYVLTYERQDGQSTFRVYDCSGTFRRQIALPLATQNGVAEYPFAIKDRILYQICENDASGDWEIRVVPFP